MWTCNYNILTCAWLQMRHKVSQTRSHLKEAGVTNLSAIFNNLVFASARNPNSIEVKWAQMNIIKHLCANGNNLFIYVKVPLEAAVIEEERAWEGEKALERDHTLNKSPEFKYKCIDPYFSPYIINAFKHVIFQKTAWFHKIPHDMINIPMVALICTLVSLYIMMHISHLWGSSVTLEILSILFDYN